MLKGIARRKSLAVLIVGLAPLVLRILLVPILPIPTPRVHDEFSYLLAADTFAHGRLVNPQHPLWIHFESMHVLVRPVYASIFPIAQGLVMAAAKVFGAHPWIGVWLSMGLMCAAFCWMLQGWVPPGWALLGGALAAARFGVFSYWMNSYFGGAMAAIGGALLLGALPRVFRRARSRDLALMAVGVAILANSRPYEGLVFCLLGGVALWRIRPPLRIFTPAAVILTITTTSMGYYFSRFSGNPFLLPYSLYRNNFTMAPHFVWQSPRPEPIYHHRVMRHFYTGLEIATWSDARGNRSPHGLQDKAATYWRFYLGPFLTLPILLTLPLLLKRRRTRYLLLAAGLFSLALAAEVWHAPHYAAPATGLVLLMVVESLRHLRQYSAWIVYGVVLGCIVFPVSSAYQDAGHGEQRALIQKKLESAGGRQLAIVRYSLQHDPGDEWVYNGADIDGSPIAWAREMDPADNRNLLRYFEGRRAWLVEPDARPPRLSGYDPAMPPDPPFRFVKLGAPDIAVLRDPEEIRRKVLDMSARAEYQPHRFSCDQWNFFFSQVTGVEAPEAGSCFAPGPRSRIVSFDEWFGWLRQQR